MADTQPISGSELDGALTSLIAVAVTESGTSRTRIARRAGLHRDALRRTMSGNRAPSLAEASRILSASGACPVGQIQLVMGGNLNLCQSWLFSKSAVFLGEFATQLPQALEGALGDRRNDLKPQWARGAAQRLARILSDHLRDLEQRDALLG